jgi:hypothetical protein
MELLASTTCQPPKHPKPEIFGRLLSGDNLERRILNREPRTQNPEHLNSEPKALSLETATQNLEP